MVEDRMVVVSNNIYVVSVVEPFIEYWVILKAILNCMRQSTVTRMPLEGKEKGKTLKNLIQETRKTIMTS